MVFLVAVILIICTVAATAAPVKDETDVRVASSLQGLQRFYVSHSLKDLQATIDTLGSAVNIARTQRKQYVARRRSVVQAWAQVLRTIELSADPTFDPKNHSHVEFCVTPPREANGQQLPPCANPNSIEDPQVRATYIAAINENVLKNERLTYQLRLRYLEDDAMLSLRLNLKDFRRVAPPDTTALDGILEQSGLSEIRRAKIRIMF
jgi:hypothetical protein